MPAFTLVQAAESRFEPRTPNSVLLRHHSARVPVPPRCPPDCLCNARLCPLSRCQPRHPPKLMSRGERCHSASRSQQCPPAPSAAFAEGSSPDREAFFPLLPAASLSAPAFQSPLPQASLCNCCSREREECHRCCICFSGRL